MFRAEHKALVQTANIGLVNIRNIELTYFLDFFLNFGTQATLLAGLITGAISQTPAITADCPYVWKFIYFVGSAVVLALAVHMLLCTVFIVIFGEGQALRGPEGSMVTAIAGMIEEQNRVVWTFSVAIFFYVAFQGVGMYFVVMDPWVAGVCSVGVLLALWGTYLAAVRIYNRFRFDSHRTEWADQATERDLNDLNPSVQRDLFTPTQTQGPSPFSNTARRRGKVHWQLPDKPSPRPSPRGPSLDAWVDVADADETVGSGIAITGYISVKLGPGAGGWSRRFFVVREGLVYFYTDKPTFVADAAAPLNHRPIELQGYSLLVGGEDAGGGDWGDRDREAPFELSLVPRVEGDIRRAWRFRCDTQSEHRHWAALLGRVLEQGGDPGNMGI